MKRYCGILLALAILGGSAMMATAQEKRSYVVIVHPDNPAKSVSKKVSRMLLKEISKWDGGLSAQPIDLDSKSPVRDDFSKDVHGRSVSSIKNYWQRQIFSGDGVPPPEVPSDIAVVDFVKTHPGGIGYVSANASLDGVKILDLASK